jgi:ubiquinone biosynthesis protein UbiJ
MLNEQIEASTAARERLAELEGKRFGVTVAGTSLKFSAEAVSGSMLLEHGTGTGVDVEIRGGAIDLLKLARSANLSDLRDSGCTLSGDISVAEQFADLLRLAIPEPEALLADWIGDMPAHALGQAARGLAGWGGRARNAFEQNLAEYLQEEKPTLIPPALAKEFSREVDRIRDDVARAERRIELLERRLDRNGSA